MPKKRINSRQKGARIEREAAKFLTSIGFPAERAARLGVKDGHDIISERLAKFCEIEVKGDEDVEVGTKALEDALSQAGERAIVTGKFSAVLWRKKHGSWRISWRTDGSTVICTAGQDDIKTVLEQEMDRRRLRDSFDSINRDLRTAIRGPD